jgi:hypothetical protein
MSDIQEPEPSEDKTKSEPVLINVHEDVLPITERLKALLRRGGRQKPASKSDGRDEIDRDTDRPTWRELRFDYENNRYYETVTFKDTGEVKLTKDEPLRGHQGRGSARMSNPPSEEPVKRDNPDTSGAE